MVVTIERLGKLVSNEKNVERPKMSVSVSYIRVFESATVGLVKSLFLFAALKQT